MDLSGSAPLEDVQDLVVLNDSDPTYGSVLEMEFGVTAADADHSIDRVKGGPCEARSATLPSSHRYAGT
jgi:hypothetical protein